MIKNGRDQVWDVVPGILVICIRIDDDIRVPFQCMIDARLKSSGQSPVASMAHNMVSTQSQGDVAGLIAAAIVDYDDFDLIDTINRFDIFDSSSLNKCSASFRHGIWITSLVTKPPGIAVAHSYQDLRRSEAVGIAALGWTFP